MIEHATEFLEELCIPEIGFSIFPDNLRYFRTGDCGPKRPFIWAVLVSIATLGTSSTLQEFYKEIRDYFLKLELNTATLMTGAGVLVLLEEEIKIDPLMFKLTVGVNLLGSAKIDFADWLMKVPALRTIHPALFDREDCYD